MLRHLAVAVTALALTVSIAPAGGWRAATSPYDLERLDGADRALGLALAAARAGGERKDVRALNAITGQPRPIEGETLIGDWQCRTMKLGGKYLALIVYDWFRCRISIGADGLLFEKLSGSQRTSGYLWPEYPPSGEGLPLRYIYLGMAHYMGEPQGRYRGPSNTLRRVAKNRDDPGILEALGRNHLRIGFPLPVLESNYNFLELRR